MIIHDTKVVNNKTWRFLFPCLRAYGEEFMQQIAAIRIVKTGIGDAKYSWEGKRLIYVLYDFTTFEQKFYELCNWVYKKGKLQTGYLFSESKNHYMLVFRIPKSHYKTYDNFLGSKYSEMYSRDERFDWFDDYALWKKVFPVINKSDEARENFKKVLNESFNTNLKSSEITHMEYEFPINLKEEIFNYEELQKETRKTLA